MIGQVEVSIHYDYSMTDLGDFSNPDCMLHCIDCYAYYSLQQNLLALLGLEKMDSLLDILHLHGFLGKDHRPAISFEWHLLETDSPSVAEWVC